VTPLMCEHLEKAVAVRRSSVALIVMTLAVVGMAAPAWAATSSPFPFPWPPSTTWPPPTVPPPTTVPPPPTATFGGVTVGTPVFVRLSPDNNIISAVTASAARVGLGPVTVDRFRADCSPIQFEVVVCRDINLIQAGVRTSTAVGPGWCVVSLDPRVGGATVGVNQVTRAMKKCLIKVR